jgi:hypothetical protein
MPTDPASDAAQRRVLAQALGGLTPLARWFPGVEASAREPRSLGFRAAYAAAARKLGPEGRLSLSSLLPQQPVVGVHWSVLDAGRWLLLDLGLGAVEEAERPEFLDQLFRGGELGEQVSFLRTIRLLPQPLWVLDTAVAACRTNAVGVFEAIACENPFPAAHFPPLAFNQMVIKAIFLEVSVRRIEGLLPRVTAELVRMAEGLKSERARAGRSIPEDIDLIVAAAK